MAISTEAIRRITIQGSAPGVEAAVSSLDKLTAAQNKVAAASNATATVTDTAAKRQLSAAAAYEKQTLSVVDGARAQANYEKGVRTAKSAMDQGVISATEYTTRVDLLKDKYGQGSAGAKAFAAATSGVSAQLVAMAAGAGPVGVFLAALGPWGIAAAVGVGLLGAAFAEANRTAQLLAKEADILQNQSEITGWSTAQLQALTMETAKHGVSVEQAMTAVVKFTAAWGDARDGSGDMLAQLRKIDPALASQMQRTKDSASALDLLVQAMRKADAAGDTSARISLARAAGGRGGVAAFSGISAAIGDAGSFASLTQNAKDAGKVIADELLKEVDNLKDELDETKKRADLLFGTIGAKPILEADLAWQKMRIEIARTALELESAAKAMPAWERFLIKIVGIKTVAKMFPDFVDKSESNFSERFSPSKGSLKPYTAPELTTAGQLKNMKEEIALLGSAATESDKLKLKLLELQAAVDANSTAENRHAAALGATAAITESYMATINLRNSALGVTATTQDLVTAKILALTKAQNDLNKSASQPLYGGDVFSLIKQKAEAAGLSVSQMSALVAHAASESAMGKNQVGDNGHSFGLFQFNDKGELQGLKDYAAKAGKEWTEFGTQIDYVINKAQNGNDTFSKLWKSAASPEDASRAMDYFERYKGYLTEGNAESQKRIAISKQVASAQGQETQITEAQKNKIIALTRSQLEGTYALTQQTDAAKVQTDAMGLGIGAATTFSIIQAKVNQTLLDGKNPATEISEAFLKQAKATGDAAQSGAQLAAQRQADFALTTAGMSSLEQQIAAVQKQLHGDDWQAFMNDGLAATMRLSDGIGKLTDNASQFAQTFVQGLISGKSAMESLGAAATSLGSKLVNAGIDNIIKDPTSPVGYIEAGVGLTMQLFGAKTAAQKAEEERIAKATKAWEAAQAAANDWMTVMNGGSAGTIGPSISSALSQYTQYAELAHAAHGGDAQQDPTVLALQNSFNAFFARTMQEFFDQFSNSISQLEQGFGPDSPFSKGSASIKSMGDSVLSFIADTKYAIGGATDANAVSMMASATKAAQDFAVTMLDIKPALTETATAVLNLQGGAQGLQGVLVKLGFSATDAAAIIATKLTTAMNTLKTNLEADLNSQINSSNGKGYLNDIAAAVAALATNRADLAAVGGNVGFADLAFKAAVQNTIDGAGLVGAAFTDLVKQFPQLAGIVRESTAALNTALDQAKQNVTSAQTTLNDAYNRESSAIQTTIDRMKSFVTATRQFRDSLLINAQVSPLNPADQLAESHKQLLAIAALANTGDETAQGQLQGAVQSFLDQSKSFNASSEQYYRDFQEVQSILSVAAQRAQTQVSVAQQQLNALDAQVSGLMTVNTSVLTVAQAVIDLRSAMAALNVASPGATPSLGGVGESSPAYNSDDFVGSLYQNLLGRTPSAGELSGWTSRIASGASSGDQVIQGFLDSAEYKASHGMALGGIVGAYANGGMVGSHAAGGLIGNGIWNQDSVFANLAGGERVMNAPTTARYAPELQAMHNGTWRGANDNGAVVVELRNLGARLDRIEAATRNGALHVREGVDNAAGTQKRSANEQRQANNQPRRYGSQR